MRDIWRKLRSVIFGTKWVVLIDHDGDRHVRPIYFSGGQPRAERWTYMGRSVALLDGGKTAGISYVDGWEPYQPLAPKKWPRFAPSE